MTGALGVLDHRCRTERTDTLKAMVEQLAGGASLRTPMAYGEYLALGETKHHEYYDGLCVVNPPTRAHSRAVAHLVDVLRPLCPTRMR